MAHHGIHNQPMYVSRAVFWRKVQKEIQESVIYQTIKTNPESAWSFLLQADYLKVMDQEQDEDITRYALAIPNTEVRTI